MPLMDIRSYLDKAPRGTAAAIAKAVGVSPVMVTQWAAGLKAVPAERCMAIERATAGAVTRRDLRPDDAHLIWPDVAAPKKKPAVIRPSRKALEEVAEG